MKFFLITLIIILLVITSCSSNPTPDTKDQIKNTSNLVNNTNQGGLKMKIISNNFKHNQDIPNKFTCQGQDIRPHLKWTDIPKETKSFAISVIDPDAPMGDFIHWLIYNIPVSITELDEGIEIPEKSIEVTNDFGKKEYGGPCPPSGKHRYFFKVYALDSENINDVNKDNFLQKIQGHTIDSAEIIGLYQKNK